MPSKSSGHPVSGKSKRPRIAKKKVTNPLPKAGIDQDEKASESHHMLEIHFQEGFTGQTVLFSDNDKTYGPYILRTKFQTGLAAIKSIRSKAGQTITFEIPELLLRQEYTLLRRDLFLTVNFVDHKILIAPVQQSPGYV